MQRTLIAAAAAVLVLGCDDHIETACAGLEFTALSTPDTATLRVGASLTAVAGAQYDTCVGEPSLAPPRQFVWRASDTTIVRVQPLDSTHAEITALRAGTATVTPSYRASGDAVPPVHITVIP